MEAFTCNGQWWVPTDPDRKWVGTLRFDKRSGAVLNVTIPTDSINLEPSLNPRDLIHGRTTQGRAVTLLRCFERSTTAGLPGVPRALEVYANAVIQGFHCDESDPLISTASVSLSHLREWLGRPGMKADFSASPGMMVRYTTQSPIVVCQGRGFSVSLRPTASSSFGRYETSMREEVRFEITSDAPTPLSELDAVVQACRDFISIACMDYSETVEYSLIPATSEASAGGTYHAVPIYSSRERNPSSLPDMLFRFADLEPRASEMLGAWLQQAEQLRYARALYFSGVYGKGFVEGKLLALTQAVEAFHRRFYPGLYIDKERFDKEVLKPLTDAIPSAAGAELRDSIASRLKFANEHSQRKRLRMLFSECMPVLRVLAETPKNWVDLIVDQRNNFTHFPAESNSTNGQDSSSERVLLYNWLLRLLLEACFMKVMGFTPEQILSIASRSGTYRQIAQRFRA